MFAATYIFFKGKKAQKILFKNRVLKRATSEIWDTKVGL